MKNLLPRESRFMTTAPDGRFKRHKLAMGFGLHGGLRAMEYTYIYHRKDNKRKIVMLKS